MRISAEFFLSVFLLCRLCSCCDRHLVSLIASLLASPFFIVLQLREEDRHGTETDLDNGAYFPHSGPHICSKRCHIMFSCLNICELSSHLGEVDAKQALQLLHPRLELLTTIVYQLNGSGDEVQTRCCETDGRGFSSCGTCAHRLDQCLFWSMYCST